MEQTLPTRDALIRRLEDLCRARESREDIAAWAMSIVDDDSLRVTDKAVWDVLKKLGAADLPASDRKFLYSLTDFREWLSQLN